MANKKVFTDLTFEGNSKILNLPLPQNDGDAATKAYVDSHTHDDRYYQESEFLNASAGAGDAGKPVKLDAGGKVDATMINDGDVSYGSIADVPSTFAPSGHNHAGTDITSGTVATARLDVGTSSGKVAAGDHAHSSYITGNETITLGGDVTGSGTTAITCVVGDNSHSHSTSTLTGLGGAAEKDVGTGSGDVAQGNHAHADGTTSAAGFISTTDKTKLDACMEVDDSGGSTTTNTWSASKIASNALYVAANFSPVSKYEAAIEWETEASTIGFSGSTGSMICTLQHGLGTRYVVVAVRDENEESEDVGYVALITTVDTNNITLEYAASDYPGVGVDRFVTIMG